MMEEIKLTGGARIGWVNASWPFATLSASADYLEVSGLLLGKYVFRKEDVIALVSTGFFSNGLRIVHASSEFPEKIILYKFGSANRLIERIKEVGFLPKAVESATPARSGIPFRWSFVVIAIALWNALFILDGFVAWKEPKKPGLFVFLALGSFFLISYLIPRVEIVRQFALKPGRSALEVAAFTRLIMLVSGMMLIMMAIMRQPAN